MSALNYVIAVHLDDWKDGDEFLASVTSLKPEKVFLSSPYLVDNNDDNSPDFPLVYRPFSLDINRTLVYIDELFDGLVIQKRMPVLVLKPGETVKKEVLNRALLKLSQAPPDTVISFLHQDLNYPDPYHHRLFRLGQGHRFKINESDPSSWQHVYHNRKGKLQQIYLPQAEIEVIPCSEG